MKKWLIVSTLITIPMFIEDFVLFLIGRYTTIPMWEIIVGIIMFGLLIGASFRMRKTKRFLGE